MDQQLATKIAQTSAYKKLTTTRSRLGWSLTALTVAAYFTFLYLVAFHKELLATPIADGATTTYAIPTGIGLIVFTIVVTGYYVKRANSEFDELTKQIVKEAK